ncbi:tRNA (guanosine(46)-N7)-methyltransferase TrmB [Sediminibacillus massiliensis]|uniref:tRNA (guanosine(46)-N7)-methyltransferase TrmB n=1 Tax=Sediminibacillus massiliensis TaxID=1926277 RepID=UPI0009888A55|nr:tRNA (guanosine(46)-N7)-methyltransferase TrmB [Sediminibacillus massiliensis]
MRTRHKPWADDYLKENNQIVELDPFQHKNSWAEVFGNDNPIHIEIGTGKGQFIAGMARQHPDINFIGIELVKSIIVSAVDKVKDSGQDNVLLINEDAKDLRELFGENEVSGVYLNFSDPWPKTRHEKRRLTFHTFLEQYKGILKEDGELTLKTDNRGLFEYSLVSFSQYGMKLKEVNLDLHKEEDPLNIKTEYEEKFSEKGFPIYRCKTSFS